MPATLSFWRLTLLLAFAMIPGLLFPAAQSVSAGAKPDLRLRPDDGPPGMTAIAKGRRFPEHSSGVLVWSSSELVLGEFMTDGDGVFEVAFTIPDDLAGSHIVTARVGDTLASDDFEIERSDDPPTETALRGAEATPSTLPEYVATPCPGTGDRTIAVSNALELTSALSDAQPGDLILLADGDYLGTFTAEHSGTAEQRVTICGSRDAVLDGGDFENGYALHITGDYWTIHGITVANALKGVMLDGASFVHLQEIEVHDIGHEAVHFRTNSSDNVIADSAIYNTGLKRAKFGEGVYIGSAVSSWGKYTGGQPDRSDRNQVLRNTIWNTSSESVDIKEGTTGGLIEGNQFFGERLTGADSWVDVKGNGYVIRGNTGTNSPVDGFQTHVINDMDWGRDTVFQGNIANVNGDGYGFYIHDPEKSGNMVMADNVVVGAAKGFANVEVT